MAVEIEKAELVKDIVAQLKAELQREVEGEVQSSDAAHLQKLEDMKADLETKLAEMRQLVERQPVTSNWTPPALEPMGMKAGLDGIVSLTEPEIKTYYTARADDIRLVQQVNDELLLTGILCRRPVTELKRYRQFMDSPLRKAMSSTGSTAGDEWVPTLTSSQLVDKFRLQLRVAALFDQIDMPSNPFEVPAVTADATAYVAGENTAPTETAITTGKYTLNAKRMSVWIGFSDELNEDSAVAVLPSINKALAQALANGCETAIINGDNVGAHMDSDVAALGASDVRKNFNGLRNIASTAGCTQALTTFSTANLRLLRGAMGAYGTNQGQLAFVTGTSGYMSLLGLTEVITVDKYGQWATVLTGELAKLDGAPVVVSEFIRQDLNASGVYDGVTTNNTVLLLVNREQFSIGVRKGVTVEPFYDNTTGTHKLVGRYRWDIQPVRGTSAKAVGLGYDIAV